MKKIMLCILVLCLSWASQGFAAGDQNAQGDAGMPPPSQGTSMGGRGQMRPIPQEAITACNGKAVGASCSVGTGGAGTCNYTPDKQYFACKPSGRGPGGPSGSGGYNSFGGSGGTGGGTGGTGTESSRDFR